MKKILTLFLVCFYFTALSWANVRLPGYYSDNMMFQRDMPIHVWGWSESGESITVEFNGQQKKLKADKTGVWHITFEAMPYGGPYGLVVKGESNTIYLSNILIGDIWICSGQSNMGRTVISSKDGEEEILNATYPKIRLLTVQKNVSNQTQEDILAGGWKECSTQSIWNFSAVAYFFGRELHKKLDIPIGLINTSWGGTKIETWISSEMMKTLPEYTQTFEEMKLASNDFVFGEQAYAAFLDSLQWDKGIRSKWYSQETSMGNLHPIMLPMPNEREDIAWGGSVWFKKDIFLTEDQIQKDIVINLGVLDDWDVTYFNGKRIGNTYADNQNRKYPVPVCILKVGKNTVTVKVINARGTCGFFDKPEQIFCQTAVGEINLSGIWMCDTAYYAKTPEQIKRNTYPSLLYNTMIHPLLRYPIKGAIWYQGESNTSDPVMYAQLFKNLIIDWRNRWNQDDFPFYFVQLANFKQPQSVPGESKWAELREAQHSALELPNTGEAITIDVGEADDIHPMNKQEVGYRLALQALANTYGFSLQFSGPVFRSMKVEGNKVILSFYHTGEGLICKDKYGYLKAFSIAGSDKKHVWAKAYIEDDKVIVYSDGVNFPVAVRYAWADNPDDANLYNSDGLPATPFRTDNW